MSTKSVSDQFNRVLLRRDQSAQLLILTASHRSQTSLHLMARVDSGFVLSHSRVALDIDFLNETVQGIVDLTITPLTPSLKELYLHCRQCVIRSVKINGISASFVHLDPNENLVKSAKKGDFRSCPKLLLETMKKADDGELKILVPDGLKCETMQFEQSVPGNIGPACYRSWNLVIDYILERPDVSVKFVGEAHNKTLPRKHPHMFVCNVQNQARWWMPCVDKIHDKFTYDFEITIPRTVYHAYSANSDSMSSDMEISGTSDQGDTGDDSLSLKMIAVCSGELVEQFVHPDDPSKSVWVYSVRTAMDAASVILSVGPFEIIPIHGWGRPALPMARNTDSILPDEELLDAGVQRTGGEKGLIFVLPEYKRDIRVSTFFLSQALEFFEQWVGSSFPFSSFKLVFVEESYSSIVTGSTMVLASVDLLVDETLIDHVYEARLCLARSLSTQWFGHYMAPNKWTDVWVLVGFSNWMTALFMKKMFGNNEFKYRQQQDISRVCELDVNQPPLCPDPSILGGSVDEDGSPAAATISALISRSFSSNDDTLSARSELMLLKSPLVLSMLEKRMGKNLLQKIANKLMVSAMSGELPTGLSTTNFLKLVRKISGKLETKEFADQWIFRSGCPILTIRYHFNRKKMVIELKVKQECTNVGVIGANQRFSGAFMVRVQEPGGTFDTEVRIEEKTKQYDIIYHTKYKRIRRRAGKKSKRAVENEDDDEDEDVYYMEEDERANDAALDIEAQNQDPSCEFKIVEPDRITFEWIRLDPDNVWICAKTFEQEDFMWNALLRKEKDIGAQSEAIVALSKIQSLASLNTITSFARDQSHFYHLRLLAVRSLSKFDSEELKNTALGNLNKMYYDLFCIPVEGATVPKRNNFSSFQDYKLRQEIIRSLARFIDARGVTPTVVRVLFIDLLRYNDNSGNEFSDGEWISLLIKLICDAFIIRPKARTSPLGRAAGRSVLLASADIEEFEVSSRDKKTLSENSAFSHCVLTSDEQQSFKDAYAQVIRQLSRDKVLPSHRNAVTISCLESLLKWQLSGLLPISYMLFLGYSRDGNSIQIRQMAVDCLITLSAMCNEDINEYLMDMALHDQDSWFRHHVLLSMVNFLSISLYGHKPSVTIEHAVTWLSKQVILLAISVGKKIGPHTSSRMWLLFMRLFEMARTCAENDPDLSQLCEAHQLAQSHCEAKAFVSPSTNANMMATVATSSTSISAHKANSASNSTILSTMVHTEASDKALAATTLTTHPATALGNSSEIALTSRTPLRMTFSVPNPAAASKPDLSAKGHMATSLGMNTSKPIAFEESVPTALSKSASSYIPSSAAAPLTERHQVASRTPQSKDGANSRLVSDQSITKSTSAKKRSISETRSRHPSQTAQSLSTPAPSISSKAASSAAPILLEAQSPERMILDELMIRKDAVIFLHPVDRTIYPDYYEKISLPIDLHTISSRVLNNKGKLWLCNGEVSRGLLSTPQQGSLPSKSNHHESKFKIKLINARAACGGVNTASRAQVEIEVFLQVMERRKANVSSKGQKSVGSLFTTWEISQFPKGLPAAIACAERRELVRGQLHKLQNKRNNTVSGVSNGCLIRQKYGRALGQIGYEQLPLLELQDTPEAEVLKERRFQMTSTDMLQAVSHNEQTEYGPDIPGLRDGIKDIVADIESTYWLTMDERQQLSSTFISDIASRYGHLQHLSPSGLNPKETRRLVVNFFGQIKVLTRAILELLRRKKKKMSRIDIFASGPNQDRLRTVFLTELQRRIDTKKILKRAVLELCDDFAASLSLSAVKPDAVPSELQELRHILDKISRPIPIIASPIVISRETMGGLKLRSNYQAERTLLGMPRPEKTTHVKLSEQDKLTIEVHRQHKVISEDLIALLCKPQNSDEKSEMVADEGELWNEPGDNELDTETLAELGYDDANIQLIATNATDDPILQAHTEMSQHVRHKITIPENKKTPLRYLHLNSYRHFPAETLQTFRSAIIENSKKPALQPSDGGVKACLLSSSHNRISNEKSSVRSFDSRFSTRIPKDFISLAAEPTSGAGEFSNELENRVINVLGRFELPLNEKLTRFKEVEELYDEIMKTVRGNHLEAYEDEDQVLVCPTAPLDVQIQITDNFLGVRTLYTSRKNQLRQVKMRDHGILTKSETALQRDGHFASPFRASRQRSARVQADEFAVNRAAAMKKTQSSKSSMRYNYGGYIPAHIKKQKKRTPKEEFGAVDYAEFLKGRICDFLPGIIFQELDKQESPSEIDEIESALLSEDHKKDIEDNKQMQKDKLKRMFVYDKDSWNPGVIDYIQESTKSCDICSDIGETAPENGAQRNSYTVSQEKLTDSPEMDDLNIADTEYSKNKKDTDVSGDLASDSIIDSSRTTPFGTSIKPNGATQTPLHTKNKSIDSQAELEVLWMTLKMPVDQKLDMAIKYGSHKFTKLETAIKLWQAASDLIIQREALLQKIEDFEMTASDPSRFFSKGYTGSSAARLKEAVFREEIMRCLHSVETKIKSIASHIKYELRETLTYDGVPYLEKIKKDYIEIIKRCSLSKKSIA
ncbi:hypothetical protein BASA61_007054 [Batrachochytrium salamandrivorans]|nr:hypothetical protein BASA61_007054 [Batrachochytrium salamandrivorans]